MARSYPGGFLGSELSQRRVQLRHAVGTLGMQLAHRVFSQVDATGAAHDAITDRMDDGGFADHLIPRLHR